jgi:predicted 2-oxoglutarate/Fe(II)-dependent dioxygenase YbiX|tara:strand:- start:476 stop:1003 length:528 start_codon:yes stop_codon:yes gene_type:complete
MKPDTKFVIEEFVFKNHRPMLINYFEDNKHLCNDELSEHAHRNLQYDIIKSETIRSILKYYVTKTCYFIDHYFKDKVGPWDEPKICRWTKGETMSLHTDRTTVDKMKYSSLIYLNDDYEGGELKFVNGETFKFKSGTNVIFRSDAYNAHQVLEIKKGHRYTIPTWYTTRLSFLAL